VSPNSVWFFLAICCLTEIEKNSSKTYLPCHSVKNHVFFFRGTKYAAQIPAPVQTTIFAGVF